MPKSTNPSGRRNEAASDPRRRCPSFEPRNAPGSPAHWAEVSLADRMGENRQRQSNGSGDPGHCWSAPLDLPRQEISPHATSARRPGRYGPGARAGPQCVRPGRDARVHARSRQGARPRGRKGRQRMRFSGRRCRTSAHSRPKGAAQRRGGRLPMSGHSPQRRYLARLMVPRRTPRRGARHASACPGR